MSAAEPPVIFAVGDVVRLRAEGREVEATVEKASSTGISLALTFEAILLGSAGMMLVQWNPLTGGFHEIFSRERVTIARLDA